FEFSLGLQALRDIGDPHQPQTRIARALDRIELERVVGGLAGAVGLRQSNLDVPQRVRFRRIPARATVSTFAVTIGAISFSKLRLPKSWRRNSAARDCDT